MKLTKEQKPVAYLRKDQLRSVRRFGPMHGEINNKPRPDLVAVYMNASDDKTLEQHRAEFESWLSSVEERSSEDYAQWDSGHYLDWDVQRAWLAWQAARGISE